MSLKDTYQSRKNLLASNLTAQGVTASGSEGLTTLIDKVLDIPTGGGAVVDNLTITTNKNILSYYDSETATITVIATDNNNQPVTGATIILLKEFTILGVLTTNNNGIATYTYNSAGIGDINIYAVTNNTITQIQIEDCKYFNDGSSVGTLEVGSGVSCTSNGEYITITTSTSGEKDVKLPTVLTGDWEYDVELAEDLPSSGGQLTFKIGTGQEWGAFNPNNTITVNLGTSKNFNRTVSKGMTLKITYINGVMTVYWNNEQLTYNPLSLSSGVKIGYYTNSGRYQYIKNIKLKPIPSQ